MAGVRGITGSAAGPGVRARRVEGQQLHTRPHIAPGPQRHDEASEASCVFAERVVAADDECRAQRPRGQQEGRLFLEQWKARLPHHEDAGRGWRSPGAKPLTDDDSVDPAPCRSVRSGSSQRTRGRQGSRWLRRAASAAAAGAREANFDLDFSEK